MLADERDIHAGSGRVGTVAKNHQGRSCSLGFYADNTSCPGTAPWPGLLSYAAKRLTKAGAWVYLDSAHSNWTNANGGIPGRAALLKRSGIGYARRTA